MGLLYLLTWQHTYTDTYGAAHLFAGQHTHTHMELLYLPTWQHTHTHTCSHGPSVRLLHCTCRFAEAAAAYEAAGDMDSVVRLSLGPLRTPQRAYAVVRRTHSVEAASLLAKYCLQAKDFEVRSVGCSKQCTAGHEMRFVGYDEHCLQTTCTLKCM